MMRRAVGLHQTRLPYAATPDRDGMARPRWTGGRGPGTGRRRVATAMRPGRRRLVSGRRRSG